MPSELKQSVEQATWDNLGIEFYLADTYGRVYRLRPPHTYSFGRDEQVNFQITDGLVSRRQCELRWQADARFTIIDLASRNGSWLNGERLSGERPLRDNDTLRIGGQAFTFRVLPRGADASALAKEASDDGMATMEQVPGSQLSSAAVIKGQLGKGGLLPLLDFFSMTAKSGALNLADGGIVWLLDGAPIDAGQGEMTGLEALQALAAAPGGSEFTFVEGQAAPAGPRITGDSRALLISLARASVDSGIDADDLRRAQNLQARLLQRIPSLAGYGIGVRYQAASSVGGDLYDIGQLPDGRVLIVLGDVSGHGVQAALVVAIAVKSLRMLRPTCSDELDLLVRLNEEIRSDLLPGQFLTCFAATLHPATGQMRVVLAGHHPGWLCVDGRVTEVGRSGMAIGLSSSDMLRKSLHPVEFTLPHGGMLVQCTDGLLEAQIAGGEEFGDQRLIAMLEDADLARLGAQEKLDEVASRFTQQAGVTLADDLTLLSIERLPGIPG